MKLFTENIYKDLKALSVFDFEDIDINRGEAVGIYLHKFYSRTEDLIAQLLYKHHPVTLKYKDRVYIFHNIDEWRKRIQDPNDQLKEITIKHPLKQMFDDSRKERSEKFKVKKRRIEIARHQTDASDEEVLSLLRAFAPLYEIDVDYNDRLSVLRAYEQINFYLDNDIEYAREVPGISPVGTPFEDMMSESIPTSIEEILVGDPELLEDLHYKCKHSTVLIDQIISSMV